MKKQNLFNSKVDVIISENQDGNMRFFEGNEQEIIQNQARLGESVGLSNHNIARLKTIYDDRKNFTEYFEITRENIKAYSIQNPEKGIPTSDGIITKESEIGLLLPLADCLGIVVFDGENLGLLHAGRHNIEQDGPKKFIEYFVEKLGSKPENIKVYFSPYSINYHINKLNKKLGTAAKEQLLAAGVSLDNVLDAEEDTVEETNLPSHSSGDTRKRFAILAKIKQL